MALIISRRSFYCPNFATTPVHFPVFLNDNALTMKPFGRLPTLLENAVEIFLID